MINRLGISAANAPIVSHPGETTRDYLNGHMAEVASTYNANKDITPFISLLTNDLNSYYIEVVKADILTFLDQVADLGFKKPVWALVGACKSAYAYARDASGNIIGGSNIAQRQAGFDAAKVAINAWLKSLVGTRLAAVSDISVYPNIYEQVNATDSRYFYQANTGPYANETGAVHENDYGSRYYAEAGAQALAPLLGIVLNPATVSIPDAPAVVTPPPTSTGQPVATPYTIVYEPITANEAYVEGVFTKISGGPGWNAGGRARVGIDLALLEVGEVSSAIYEQTTLGSGIIYGFTAVESGVTINLVYIGIYDEPEYQGVWHADWTQLDAGGPNPRNKVLGPTEIRYTGLSGGYYKQEELFNGEVVKTAQGYAEVGGNPPNIAHPVVMFYNDSSGVDGPSHAPKGVIYSKRLITI